MRNLCETCSRSDLCDYADEDVTKCNLYSTSWYDKYCIHCVSWKEKDKSGSNCKLGSVTCITQIWEHKPPSRFRRQE